jgi:peptidase C25-like protein/parallel beta helix pectate lyase-like protein
LQKKEINENDEKIYRVNIIYLIGGNMTYKLISLAILLLLFTSPLGVSSSLNQFDISNYSIQNYNENSSNQRTYHTCSNSKYSPDCLDSIDASLYLETKTFQIKKDDYYIQSIDSNQELIHIENCGYFHQPGLPILPMKTMQILLPKNCTIDHIEIINSGTEKITSSVTLIRAPRQYLWSINETPYHTISDKLIEENIRITTEKELFPGITHTYVIGKNNDHTKLTIQLFPIQYNIQQKEVILISNGTINIYYTYETNEKPAHAITTTSAKNIIITPLLFYPQAKKLKEFHDSKGTPTIVVNTSWINRNFEPVDYPDVQGYKDFNIFQKIRKYDDILARKITAYLQSQSANSNLQFITLLGNAKYVPPSYYFGEPSYPVPTDFYYGSPDLDLVTNYHIGRLPVNSLFEAIKMVNKIINWNPTSEQMDHVAVAGGIPFASSFIIGELITTDSINQGNYNGLHVDKYFRTDEKFEATDVLSTLKGDYGLLYIICHGNAKLIACEEGRISPTRLQLLPKTTNTPIISCIACSSGSYDTHIIKQGRSLDKTSFAEAVLLSKGGGIAYVGGARTNDGYPLLTLNKGRVEIFKETYMAGLLTYVSEAYHQDYSYLGELATFAKETYIEENAMNDFWNQYHLYGFVLLGDPALQLPNRNKQQTSYDQPQTYPSSPVGYKPYNEYGYEGSLLFQAIDEITQFISMTDSPLLTIKQINIQNPLNPQITKTTQDTSAGKAAIVFTPKKSDFYLLRTETLDGKEDWIYYEPVRPVDDDYNPSTPGYDVTRWISIQQAINAANQNDIIYVFNGTYYENIVINSPRNLIGEHWKTTIIDGRGNDDVVTITSNECLLSQFTIQHCGNMPFNAGISIAPSITLKDHQIGIIENHITNNKNCGMYITNLHERFSSTLNIYKNSFSNNNYALYQKDNLNDVIINNNYFVANNYGIYMSKVHNQDFTRNSFENNYVGLFMNQVNQIQIIHNNFIDNTQHCQFSQTDSLEFDNNFWDDWLGLKVNIPLPKLINGYHTNEQDVFSQIKFDKHPSDMPFG